MVTIEPESLASRTGPRYRAIADELLEKITGGDLGPGDRLPTHRELAWALGVTVGTVTRAYAELERSGVVRGEVGRGTFVRRGNPEDFMIPEDEAGEGLIDLGKNYPPPGAQVAELSRSLHALSDDRGLTHLLGYQPHAGRAEHRAAGAEWIRRGGYDVTAEQVIVTAGAQHGLLAALSATLHSSDRIGVESLSFPGTRAVARMLGRRLEPIAMDDEGLLPDSVDAACRNGVRVICCVPTLHNPTCAVMPLSRRRAIAEIVQAHGATLVEDDIFGLLLEKPLPPVSSFAPEHGLYVTSLSKTIAPGLRVGFLVVPPSLFESACTAVRTSCWMAAPLMAEIATRWIKDGEALKILGRQRQEAAARMKLALDILAPWGVEGVAGALHLWFRVPEPWTTTKLVAAARDHGVLLTTEAPFVIAASDAPQALRVCLGSPSSREELETGLTRLADALRAGPEPGADLSIL